MPLFYLLLVVLALLCAVLLASPKPILAPVLILAVPAAWLIYRKPVLGVLGLLALVPLEGLFTQGSLFTGAKLISFALIGVGALQLLLRQRPASTLSSNLWGVLLLYALVWFLSLLFSEHRIASLLSLRDMLVGAVMFVLTLLFARELNLMIAARIIVLSVAVSCLPTVLGKAQLAQDGRSVGLLADPNYFALLIVVATPLALLLLRQERHRLVQLFWLIPLGIMAAGLMKTESRSAIVVLLLVLSALGWHYRHSLRRIQPRHLGLAFVAGALAFPIALAVMPKSFIERLESLTALASGVRAYEDGSLGRRASYLFVGAQMLKANPVLGAGPGTFPVFYAHTGYAVAFSYSKNNPDLFRRAHNTYLEVISETGIAGTLTFGTVILLALLNFHRARRLAQSVGDRADAEQITHFGLAFLALVLFLMFLSAPDHKYLWIMLALSGILRQTRQYRVEQERMP